MKDLTKVILTFLLCFQFCMAYRHPRDTNSSNFKICVPQKALKTCQKLYSEASNSGIMCKGARDRIECLALIKNREADFVIVDPEDMYVAYHLDNEDFDIVSEIRTIKEKHQQFRYDGIILVKKGSPIHGIKDLKGKKSCHTGFGRNVGYKIPLTKLRKHGVLKLSSDPELSSTEKELDALTNFFEKSCIVGDYSPDKLVDSILKKRYSNLCALCENPDKCNYPDKYSGYEGAVRCVVEGNGHVAFTKTYFVKQFFGLPISEGDQPSNPRADVNEYEYLCEDGTRQPITNPKPCSWAQRPWQGIMSNSDILPRKSILQERVKASYEEGKNILDVKEQTLMFIKPDWSVYPTSEVITPEKHLFKAQYKDVIERDGTEQGVLRFCVSDEVSFRKCKWLKRAAYSRDLRPQLECILKDSVNCIQATANGKTDAVVLANKAIQDAENKGLLQLLTEVFEDKYIGVIHNNNNNNNQENPSSIEFDSSNIRSLTAALNLLKNQGHKTCSTPTSTPNAQVKIVSSNELKNISKEGKSLLCTDLSRKDFNEWETCNLDYSLPRAVMVRKSETRQVKDNIKHVFVSIGNSFGRNGKLNDVFDLFGEFENGSKGVIFSSDATNIVPGEAQHIDKKVYFDLHCF